MSADRTCSTAPSPIAFAGATLDRAAHLRDDIDRLGSIRYNPHTLLENERPLIEHFAWAAALPNFGGEPRREVNGRDEKGTCRSLNHVHDEGVLSPERVS